ncbi:hypothetical protein GCM10028857_20890 [Salinarchaeum chitinilyticum]
MLVASLIVLLGLAYSVVAVQFADVRLSGVVVVPMTAVYVLYEFAMFPLAVFGVAVAYATILALRRWTLLFGRSLLIAGIVAGALVPVVAITLLSAVNPTGPVHVAFVGSILPGVAAYNYSREDRTKRRRDVVASLAGLASLLAVGYMLVNPTTGSMLGTSTPAILVSEHSAVAGAREVAVPTYQYEPALPHWIGTLGLLLGIGVTEGIYARWGVRLTGMAALPLIALFTLQYPAALAAYVVGIALVFALVSAVAHATLVYGRVLLSLAIGAGIVLSLVIGAVGPALPGFVLLFLGLLTGVGGYNVHRVPPAERRAALTLSGAVFVWFLAGFWAVASDPAVAPSVPAVVAGGVVTLLALRELVVLEGSRPSDLGGLRGGVDS